MHVGRGDPRTWAQPQSVTQRLVGIDSSSNEEEAEWRKPEERPGMTPARTRATVHGGHLTREESE